MPHITFAIPEKQNKSNGEQGNEANQQEGHHQQRSATCRVRRDIKEDSLSYQAFPPSVNNRANISLSILPPESTTPTRFMSSGNFLKNTAAAAAAPEGSTSNFIRNNMNRIAAVISSSVTVKTFSAFARVIGKVSAPGVCTRRPSAIVGGGGILTRSPLANDCCVSLAVSGSTAKHLMEGFNDFAAVLTPANSPPPLHGVRTQSRSGTSSSNSNPQVPWPAMIR